MAPAMPVTVAIATRNRGHFLSEALASCAAQTIRPESVIVVDDGSEDATEEVVRAFRELDVIYIRPGRVGFGNARNLATALCATKYLCVMDDDDIMLPDRLRDHMASFASGAQISYGGWINFNSCGELEFRPGKQVDEDVIAYVGAALTHGACCFETALLREFPYRDGITGGADYDLALRLVRSEARFGHTDSYVLLRRKHDSNLSISRGDSQSSMRDSLVGTMNLTRSDEEIAGRLAAGNERSERLDSNVPSLHEIFRQIGTVLQDMRVVGAVSRSAIELFDKIDRLSP